MKLIYLVLCCVFLLLTVGSNDLLCAQAQGYGVVYFAKRMLADKGMTLEGKKCIVTGSNYVSNLLIDLLF